MLDRFLEVAVAADQSRSLRNEMAEGFKQLPVEELQKIASGEIKLSFYDDDHWLCKFKGTELYDDALSIETQMLELDAEMQQIQLEDSQERNERSDARSQIYSAQDGLRLKRKLLELELRKDELSAMGRTEGEDPAASAEAAETFAPEEAEESPEEEAAEEAEEAVETEPEKAASAFLARANAAMAKFAAEEKKESPSSDGGLDPMSQAILQRAGAHERMAAHGKPLALGGITGALTGGALGTGAGMLGARALGLKGAGTDMMGAGIGTLGATAGGVGGAHLAERLMGDRAGRLASEKAYGEAAQKVKDLQKSAAMEGLKKNFSEAKDKVEAKARPALDSAQKSVYDAAYSGADSVENKMRQAKEYIKGKSDQEKNAAAAITVADQWGRELARLQKEAGLGGTIMEGLKGGAKVLGQAGKTLKQSAQYGANLGTSQHGGGIMGGAKQMLSQAPAVGKAVLKRGANWAGKNQAAAGAIGAGALGATALGAGTLGAGTGYAAGR